MVGILLNPYPVLYALQNTMGQVLPLLLMLNSTLMSVQSQ